ncbi:MAG TPA: outer membrane beta-barrel protein, partial [Burkholderiaceae bacterium]|nr:outer membrane beta-barrel protein [Burkholderiaceae bacterium]
TLAGALAVSTSVLADAPLEGPWAGIGMGFRSQTNELTLSNGADIQAGKTSVFGMVQGGYAWQLHSDVGDWNVGPYVFYLPGNVNSNTAYPGTASAYTTWKNQWGFGLQPGYYLGKETVVYLKVGYNQITGQLNASNAQGQISPSDQFHGVGYGLGLKHQFAGNWLIWVDTYQASFSSKTYTVGTTSVEVKPKQTVGTFGIGYVF